MRSRYLVLALLFLATALAPALIRSQADAVGEPRDDPAAVPPEALEALQQGRYWRASRILRSYLAVAADTTPEALLLAAQAEAGWGAWPRVEQLLAGRQWLDRAAGGHGWQLLGRSRYEQGDWPASGTAYGRFLEVATDAGERERGLAEARRAQSLSRDGKHADALAAFDRAARLLPQLGDWVGLYAAQAAAAAGDTAAMERRLQHAGPDLAVELGWSARVRAYRNARDLGRALAVAEEAAVRLPDASERAAAHRATGDLRLLRGDTAGARVEYRKAMEIAPGASGAVDAARALSDLPGATARDRLRIGELYMRHGNIDRGVAGLSAYLESGQARPDEIGRLRFDIARGLFRVGRYDDAEKRLVPLVSEASDPAVAAEAMYLLARARYRQGARDAALATFRGVAERFPDQDAATRALFLVADLAHDAGSLGTARDYYRRAVASNADLNEAGLALMRLAGIAMADGDHRAAVEAFEDYRTRHPTGRRIQQATYWAARAYDGLGEHEKARDLLRRVWRTDALSFYGIRAGERLGLGLADVAMEPAPQPTERVQGDVARALFRLDLLRELDDDRAATLEVQRIRRHFSDVDGGLYLLAEALNDRGYTYSGIMLGWDIYRREGAWNPRLLRIIYPFPYRSLVLAEADERRLDPFLVAGLIRQESMFNAGVSSPVGAVGLMQIMPETGKTLARRADIDRFQTDMLKQPEINIHLGTAYLEELIDRYDGRLPAVLAAYNAGPSRVARWREFPEWRDDELFGERIPYDETRDYLKKVQQNVAIYRGLYGPPAGAEPLGR